MSKGGKNQSINQKDTVGGMGEKNCKPGTQKQKKPSPHPSYPRKQASTSNMKNMSINIKTTAISTKASDTAKVTRVGESYVNRYGSSLNSLPQETP